MDRKRRRFHCRQEERRHPDKTEIRELPVAYRMVRTGNITGTSQGRGNSGIFLQDMYEIQVLDCYNNETYVNGQTGSVYKQTPPLANAMRKPGEWNVYDIIYSAPYLQGRRHLSCSAACYGLSRMASYCRITRLSWVQRNISVSRKS